MIRTRPSRRARHVGRLSLLLFVLLVCASPAFAVQTPGSPANGAVPLPQESGRAAFITAAPPAGPAKAAAIWGDFTARHSGWDVLWNALTATPHRAFGAGIRVAGTIATPQQAQAAALGFLRSESALTRAAGADLQLAATEQAGRVWYVHFQQRFQGVPLLLTDVTVRLDVDGSVFAFGSDTRTGIQLDVVPTVDAATARVLARAGLVFDPNADSASGGDELYVLPLETATAADYALVRRVRVSQAEPPHEWDTFVDAHSGLVRWRFDRVRYASVSGTVTGLVHPQSPEDVPQTLPVRDCAVTVTGTGGAVVQSDVTGLYSRTGVSGTISLTARMRGPFAAVSRNDGGSTALFSQSGINPNVSPVVDIPFTNANSIQPERDTFYNTTRAHAYIKGIDPSFVALDHAIPVLVNIPQTCNAFWDGTGLNFFAAGAGCNNTGSVSDVVFHEYGHGINDNLYVSLGSPLGMINGALHEGTADINAAMVEDDPVIGQGFFVGGGHIRDLVNTNTWPRDVSGEVHTDGLIIGGAFWDLRLLVGLSTTQHLAHFAKYGLPDDVDTHIAYEEVFLETLVADDDDGNLANQTPHWSQILQAFNQHGIGPSLYVAIAHTEHADTVDMANSLAIAATVTSGSALFAVDPSSVQLVYTLDGGSETVAPMTPAGGGVFNGAIPAQPLGTLVRYSFRASAAGGSPITLPETPQVLPFSFLVGPQIQQVLQTFEAAASWTVNPNADDTATTGRWVQADPIGSNVDGVPAQPEDDHTLAGVQCFVTGNAASPADPAGTEDVDGGKTTLQTPVFNLSGMHHPAIRYWRWYTNNLGSAPGTDVWRVKISNDGGTTWSDVENTLLSANVWSKVIVRVEDILAPTDQVRLRFIAEDAPPGSLVEAAVDDFEIVSFDATDVGTPSSGLPQRYLLAQNRPNPFNPSTMIAFDLPQAGHATLRIYDVSGRMIRSLLAGELTEGSHSVRWDGRDANGAAVASGTYLYRIEAGDFQATRSMSLVK
jgi:Zn-dependent metalloprotease